MDDQPKKNGIHRLLKRYRRKFRIPENLNHYSEKDYAAAEKKFLKMCLLQGGC